MDTDKRCLIGKIIINAILVAILIAGIILLVVGIKGNNTIMTTVSECTVTGSITATATFNVSFNIDSLSFQKTINDQSTKIKNLETTINTYETEINQKIETTVNEYKIKLEDYSTKVSVLNSSFSNVINNYYNGATPPFVVRTNPNKSAIDALKKIFKPLEDLLRDGFNINNPFKDTLFDDFDSFVADMANTDYFFTNPVLNDKFLDLCSASRRLWMLSQVCFTDGPQPGLLIGTWRKYDQSYRHEENIYTAEDVASAEKCCADFNKSYIDTINAYRELIRVWNQIQ